MQFLAEVNFEYCSCALQTLTFFKIQLTMSVMVLPSFLFLTTQHSVDFLQDLNVRRKNFCQQGDCFSDKSLAIELSSTNNISILIHSRA